MNVLLYSFVPNKILIANLTFSSSKVCLFSPYFSAPDKNFSSEDKLCTTKKKKVLKNQITPEKSEDFNLLEWSLKVKSVKICRIVA